MRMTTLADIDRLAGHTREVGVMTNEPLLLLSEAAELLHVSEDHLASLARSAGARRRRLSFKSEALYS
jgi:hypothetical protein